MVVGKRERTSFFLADRIISDEIQVLVERYDKLIGEFSYNYKIFVPSQTEIGGLVMFLKEMGIVGDEINLMRYCVENKGTNLFFSSMNKKFFKGNSNVFLVISFNMRNKDLRYYKGEFRSDVMESI